MWLLLILPHWSYVTEEKARKTCCNDQLHVKASCGFFPQEQFKFLKSIKSNCMWARKLFTCIGFVIGRFKWSVMLFCCWWRRQRPTNSVTTCWDISGYVLFTNSSVLSLPRCVVEEWAWDKMPWSWLLGTFLVLGQDVVVLNGPLLSLNGPYICLC